MARLGRIVAVLVVGLLFVPGVAWAVAEPKKDKKPKRAPQRDERVERKHSDRGVDLERFTETLPPRVRGAIHRLWDRMPPPMREQVHQRLREMSPERRRELVERMQRFDRPGGPGGDHRGGPERFHRSGDHRGDHDRAHRGGDHRGGPERFHRGDDHRGGPDRSHRGDDHRAGPERFRRSRTHVGNILFCCVDSIDTRKVIWESVQGRVKFFVDGRMSAEVIRVLAVADVEGRRGYPLTLFAGAEAYAGSCTARSTIFAANICAGLMVSQFSRWLRKMPVDGDLMLNLLASELSVTEPAVP